MANVLSRQKLKPLFIGFGKQANEYAKVLSFLKIQISAVCVRNLNKDKSKIDRFKIKHRFSSINKALSTNTYNCVFVFLPWYTIDKKIIQILKKTKKIIFCEKPIALSYQKIKKIHLISNKYNRNLFILYNRRFYFTLQFLEKNIENNMETEIFIPEKVKTLIKSLGKKIDGKIKYHYSSHWIDFFKFLFRSKIIKIVKKKENYLVLLNKTFKKKKIKINFFYSEEGRISALFRSKKKIFKLNSLEKLYEFNNRKSMFIKKIDETTMNKFKPGVFNLVKDILNKKFHRFMKIDQLLNDYFHLRKLPH